MHSLSDVEQEAIAMQIKAKDATFKAPIAKLRVLPKKNSFRPIMTFNNKQGNKKLTYNKILEDAQLVLRNLKVNKFNVAIYYYYYKFIKLNAI